MELYQVHLLKKGFLSLSVKFKVYTSPSQCLVLYTEDEELAHKFFTDFDLVYSFLR